MGRHLTELEIMQREMKQRQKTLKKAKPEKWAAEEAKDQQVLEVLRGSGFLAALCKREVLHG